MSGRAEFDHLVIGARTLQEGVAFAEATLGVVMPEGGAHPLMGTHNHLLRLGAASFLEVIAPDPAARAPGRPRWFGLDHPPEVPRLLHWVLRMPGLAARRDLLPAEVGEVIEQTRGALRWQITVPRDGSLPFGGAFPSVIDWGARDDLPPCAMPGAGFSMTRLEVAHPDAGRIGDLLAPLLDDGRICFAAKRTPGLTAWLEGPRGTVVLGGGPR
ncbi:VOC family protein [Pseudooceanicola sediminis]|uniref:VOC family protein n=1 Tax=Pseudooceanicola sediminis TaxID=2211117 RepID=A0A399J7D7_9RHOB|nr:VOC family protein [Pseudooceanicola sediminis]KAA2315652.1 VOC family protein [Puniceibacterium sp. HSS470]RII40149.1 VOC family protein [Pseudooceanicola sediminis]